MKYSRPLFRQVDISLLNPFKRLCGAQRNCFERYGHHQVCCFIKIIFVQFITEMKLLNFDNKTIVISCTNYLKSTCTLDGQWSTVTLCQVSGSGTGIRCTRVVTMVLVWGE